MNPEIKSAIAEEAHKASIQVAERFSEGFEICVHDVVKTANYRFKDGAEYGYKLGLAHGRCLERTDSGVAVTSEISDKPKPDEWRDILRQDAENP